MNRWRLSLVSSDALKSGRRGPARGQRGQGRHTDTLFSERHQQGVVVCTVHGRPRPQGPTRPVGIWSVKGITEIHGFLLCQDNDVRQTRSFHHVRTFCRLVNCSMGKSGPRDEGSVLRTQSDCQPSPGTQPDSRLQPQGWQPVAHSTDTCRHPGTTQKLQANLTRHS